MVETIAWFRHGYSSEPPGHSPQYFIEYHSSEGNIKTFYFGQDYDAYRDMLLSHHKGDPWPWTTPPPPPPTPPPPSPPPKICTPGEHKCVGGDLYVCNADGTEWILEKRNSPLCKETGGCPDFWTDPIGAVVCWIISFIEQALNLISGGFLTLLSNVKNFLDNFSTALADFIRDPIAHVQAWVSDIIPTLQDWWNDIFQGVNDWWTSTSETVKSWINTAVGSISDWIDSSFKNIGAWWNNTSTSVRAWINNAVKGVKDWINNFSTTIGNWWDNTRKNIGDWWSDTVKAVGDWIDNTTKNIGEWWNSTWTNITQTIQSWIANAVSFVTDKFKDFTDWLGSLPGTIADYIGEQIKNMQEWVNDTIPGMVEAMFDWAKPVIDPVINAANWLGELLGIIQGEHPEDPTITNAKNKIQEEKEAINRIIEGLE